MSQNHSKPIFVFVGAFIQSAKDGTIGGQTFACTSLLNSPLSTLVDWRLIDSTMRSQPPPNLLIRSFDASERILKLIKILLFDQVDGILIFSAYVPSSFLEKGLMCILGHLFRKRVVISLRSEIQSYSHNKWFQWFSQLVVHCSNIVICQSQPAAENLRQLINCSEKKITVIPNWIDSEAYKPSERIIQSSASAHPTTFLFIGWLEIFKGVHELLDAVRLLADEMLSFNLIICGDGSQREFLENYCLQLNLEQYVEFRGWVTGEDKLKAFWEADIFVLPSHSEGLPNAVLEAMAAGLAIISTKVGGLPTLITEGENGFLVTPRDIQAIAHCMKHLLLEPELTEQMGQANQKKIQYCHDTDQAWPRVAKVLSVTNY